VPWWRHFFDASSAGEFLDRFTDLYLDSFLTNVTVGVLLGAIGLFVILRRMVFLSAALSQVAGAGLALAFFLGTLVAHDGTKVQPAPRAAEGESLDQHQPEDSADQEIQGFLDEEDASRLAPSKRRPPGAHSEGGPRLPAREPGEARPLAMAPPGTTVPALSKPPASPMRSSRPPTLNGEVPGPFHHGRHEPVSPLVLSLLLTVAVALLLSGMGGGKWRSTRESVVGLVFIVASAGSIILSQMAEKGAHEIAEFLFGTVIFIPPEQQRLVAGTAAFTLLVYGWLFKDFVFVSFDPTAARAGHYPVWLTNGTLFVLIAVSIAVCTRAVGAMPVFALTVLPPAAALQIHDRLGPAVLTSALLGAVAAAGGYLLSGLLNLSAGPLIVLVASLCTATTAGFRFTLGRLLARRARRTSSGKRNPSQ
jgi:zinc transport system permease protein